MALVLPFNLNLNLVLNLDQAQAQVQDQEWSNGPQFAGRSTQRGRWPQPKGSKARWCLGLCAPVSGAPSGFAPLRFAGHGLRFAPLRLRAPLRCASDFQARAIAASAGKNAACGEQGFVVWRGRALRKGVL